MLYIHEKQQNVYCTSKELRRAPRRGLLFVCVWALQIQDRSRGDQFMCTVAQLRHYFHTYELSQR